MALVARMRAPEAPYRADAARRLAGLVPDGVHRTFPQAGEALKAALHDADPRVRRVVVWLVTAPARRRVFDAMPRRPGWMDPRLLFRVLCVDPKSGLFDDDDLLALLDDPDARVRIQAADTLAAAGDQRAVPAALAVLGDREAELRSRGAEAIEILLWRMFAWWRPEVVEQVLGPLLGALGDPDKLVRLSAVRALGETRDSRAAPGVAAVRLDACWASVVRDALDKLGRPARPEPAGPGAGSAVPGRRG